jgi:hypothetical protein
MTISENHGEALSREPVFAAMDAPLALGRSFSRARRAASFAPGLMGLSPLQIHRRAGIAVGESSPGFALPSEEARAAAWPSWQPMREAATPTLPLPQAAPSPRLTAPEDTPTTRSTPALQGAATRPTAPQGAPATRPLLPQRGRAQGALPVRAPIEARRREPRTESGPAGSTPVALPGPAPLVERRSSPSWSFGLDPSAPRTVTPSEPAASPPRVIATSLSRAAESPPFVSVTSPHEAMERAARVAASTPARSLPGPLPSAPISIMPALTAPVTTHRVTEMESSLHEIVEREVTARMARAAEQLRSELRAPEPSRPPVDVTSDRYVHGLMRRMQAISEQERLRRGLGR